MHTEKRLGENVRRREGVPSENLKGAKERKVGVEHTESREVVKNKLDLLAQAAIKAHKAVRESRLPNYRGCRIPVPTKLNTGYMAERLHDYEDRQVIEFMRYGWPVNYEGEPVANSGCR